MWPECVYDFRGFEEEPKIVNKVVTIAQELGLDSVEPDDVTELLSQSQPLTNEVLEGLVAQLSKQQQEQEKP
jgi:hypothetical protein